MWSDDSSGRTHAADPRLPEICAARQQIEAARMRQLRLIASGHLSTPEIDAGLPMKTLPGYTLLREIHRGGQGIVYLAVQASTGRQVAVKLLNRAPLAGSGPAGLARFEREIQILSRLKHPTIVTIHDCGRDREHLYLVMDYIPGRPLDAYVEDHRTPLRETLALFVSICDGVNAAHLRGVIHRDLKPGNILVDESGQPHVLDFGLAKLADDSSDAPSARAMTVTGQFVGSLPWASPEQAEGRTEQLDIRTDVYSLGVVLYQLLTGRFPYPVLGRLDEVVRHIVQTSPIRPSVLERGIDRDLETIVLKCLAKEPERRYQIAGELARDIRRYLAGDAIEARRDSLAYLVQKGIARHRVAAIAGATMLLAVFGALFISLAFWRQAERQRILAQQNATAAHESAERADREADQARAVTDFMREVLTSVDSEREGADVRLVQVLGNASKAASQRFAAHPQQEAQLRELLGRVLLNLSLWSEAETELMAAVALWRRHAGEDDPRTLSAESDCAGVALNLSRYREVEATLTSLLPRMTRVLGADNRVTLAARRSLAIAVLSQGRIDEAEKILLELRSHPTLANDEAMQMRLAFSLIDVLYWRRAYLPNGPERSDILDQEKALGHESVERASRLHGPGSSFALQARAILARTIRDQGHNQEAADLSRALLESTKGRLPECHDVRALAMSVLATALGSMGAADEPAELFLRRIECIRRYGPPARVALISSITDALCYLERAGRTTEGELLARELSEAMQKFGGNLAFAADLYVARFVSAQGRLDEAESLFDSLLAREEQVTETRVRARLHKFLGSHLMLRGRFEEAERELLITVAHLDDMRQGTLDTYPDDVVLAFIALYDAWGKPERVGEYQRLRDEVWNGPESPVSD